MVGAEWDQFLLFVCLCGHTVTLTETVTGPVVPVTLSVLVVVCQSVSEPAVYVEMLSITSTQPTD